MDDRSVFISFFADTIKQELDHLKNSLENEDPDVFAINEYEELKKALSQEEKEMVYAVAYDLLESYTHSIMTMFDNGTKLSDSFLIDVINSETKESLTENYDAALHEDFIEVMLDTFDD